MPLLLLLLPLLLVPARAAPGPAPLAGAQPLCHFELPAEADCSLQDSAVGSCTIHMLPEENCFQLWNVWNSTPFIEGQNFTQNFVEGEEKNTTVLKIYNYKGEHEDQNGRHLLIITLRPEETWWQVDVPKGEHNITITGLLGSLNETTLIADASFHAGCPPPRINYRAKRNLHTIEIAVTPLEEQMNLLAGSRVSIGMIFSNETNFNECNDMSLIQSLNRTDVKEDVIGESIFFKGVYSKEFCFVIKVIISPGNHRRYTCGIKENMTDLPFRPAQTFVEPPAWWAVGLLFLVILLTLSSFCPRAVQKGMAKRRSRLGGRRGRSGRPLLSAPAPDHALPTHGCRRSSQPPPSESTA